MKFGIDTIRIWSHKGEVRDIEFKRNCVNVITGGSHTGKTTLLHIIDYCFLSSEHTLPHDVINDNVAWYGIKFYINDKSYVIGRKSPFEDNVSNEYYFSSIGELPDTPVANSVSDDIKPILEREFGVDERVTIPGGKALRHASKVSFRYFLMFNTISENIIINTQTYFDHQDEDRYREALPRIFDLALGIDDLENIIAREQKEGLERQIAKLRKRKNILKDGSAIFETEARAIASQAAEYGLIEKVPKTVTINSLREIIATASEPHVTGNDRRYADAKAKIFEINRRMRKLRELSDEHKEYKKTLKATDDSLKPLETLLNRSEEIIKTDAFDDLISSLKVDLKALKQSIAPRRPVETQVSAMLRDLEAEKQTIQAQLDTFPANPKSFESLKEMWLFLGETKGKLSAYREVISEPSDTPDAYIDELKIQLDEINVADVEEGRRRTIELINEVALGLLQEVSESMDNYAKWQVSFNYKEKKLQLRKPRSSLVENVGSSSNHMFLHLISFLALHEAAITKNSAFVPSFLIIDQPSRPYYGQESVLDAKEIPQTDESKIKHAFELMDNFVTRINQDYGFEFQMIVLEHVPKSLFDDMKHIHILPEFRHGNALIPPSWRE